MNGAVNNVNCNNNGVGMDTSNNGGGNGNIDDDKSIRDILLSMNSKINEMNDSLKCINGRMDVYENRVQVLEVENKKLSVSLQDKQKRLEIVEERLEIIDNQARRKNVVIGNLADDGAQDVMVNVTKFIQNSLNINISHISIDKAMRLNNAKSAVKPVLVSFTNEADRKLVLDASYKLTGSKVWVKPDFSRNWRATRKILSRFYDEVKQAGHEVKVVNDFMLIDNIKYRYNPATDKVENVQQSK